MLNESAVELCDLIWLLNPEESELVQKVRSRAPMSEVPRNYDGRDRQNQRAARSLLRGVFTQLEI
jgi:hypothetical protein